MKQAGFTLIEILIAIAIGGIIIGITYATFFLVQRVVEEETQAIVKMEEAINLLQTIRTEIESAYIKAEDFNTIIKIEVKKIKDKEFSEITFTTHAGAYGLQKVIYKVEEINNNFLLIRESGIYHKKPISKIAVLEEIEDFKIIAKNEGKDFKTWDTSFTGKCPELIKIILEFKNQSKKEELIQIVKPRLGIL